MQVTESASWLVYMVIARPYNENQTTQHYHLSILDDKGNNVVALVIIKVTDAEHDHDEMNVKHHDTFFTTIAVVLHTYIPFHISFSDCSVDCPSLFFLNSERS